MNDSKRNNIINLCVDIFAHAEQDFDCDITIEGNECDVIQVLPIAYKLFDILGLDRESEPYRTMIDTRFEEVRAEFEDED